MSRKLFVASCLLFAATMSVRAQEYKNLQVLKDVPADQIDLTMQYFMASTGWTCGQCHVRDAATGAFTFDADTPLKTTARQMIQLVQTVNAGNFGARINCATCHQGRNRPAGLQPAAMFTPDQLAAMAQQQAARQGGSAPAGSAANAQGARGAGANQPAPPPVDDIVNKYVSALGGQPALDKLSSRVMSGTYVNRAGVSVPFTIEEKGAKIRQTDTTPQGVNISVFDGTAAWGQSGTTIADLPGFRMQRASRFNDLRRAVELKTRYQTLTSARPGRLALTPASAPIDVNILRGTTFPNVTETLSFDAATGLLVRRQIVTRTPLNGSLTETIDYSDYRDVAGVKMPFTIRRNDWAQLDTMTVVDVKPNALIDDARFIKPVR